MLYCVPAGVIGLARPALPAGGVIMPASAMGARVTCISIVPARVGEESCVPARVVVPVAVISARVGVSK